MKVTKRSGIKEDYTCEKIKKAVEWACEGLDVNPLELESRFDSFLFDGIGTVDLQENLIEHGKALCSPEKPDWTLATGRLYTMQRWGDTKAYTTSFLEYVKSQCEKGVYSHPNIHMYTDDEIDMLGGMIDPARDLLHSYASVVTASSKYLLPGENIQEMFMVEAMIIASIEPTKEKMLDCAIRWYNMFSEREISLATPWLSNLRNDGNISSCFILDITDDLESIFATITDAARISKNGGGIGIHLGRLRSKNSDLMGKKGIATGVGGWIKLFNDTAVYVNQGGKRKGAITTALPVWHNDIPDFLELQTEAGDQRKKAYDIKPQVCVPDYFMELAKEYGNEWYTFDPYELDQVAGIDFISTYGSSFKETYLRAVDMVKAGHLKVVEKHDAKELLVKVAKVQFETGMPYIAFVDEINRHNPNRHVAPIPCGNLCQESFSGVIPNMLAHTCNLASLVVGRIPLEDIEYVAGEVLHILDNGISLTKNPISESKAHNELLRTVGVGVQGWHDLLAREGKTYYDEDFTNMVFEKIALGVVRKSIELAKERGAFPAYKGSSWDTGEKFNHFRKYSKNPKVWDELETLCQQYGIRNSQMTSPAPNTSTSIFMDAGAGVMPLYSSFFYEDNGDGVMPVVAMHLKTNPLGYSRTLERHNPWELTRPIGWMQRWVDTGISAEYLMNKNAEDFEAMYLWRTLFDAWENKTKNIYYIRTLKVGEKLVKSAGDCESCAG